MKKLPHICIYMFKVIFFTFMCGSVFTVDDEIELNFDMDKYKWLHVNETLKITCKNLLNKSPPSWIYSSRLHNDRRMKMIYDGVGGSSFVISNAKAEDAGQYTCEIEHEYDSRTFRYNKTMEVIVNAISDLQEAYVDNNLKLSCKVHAYPSAEVVWNIDYDNEDLNPQQDEPDEDYFSTNTRKVVSKSEGCFILQPYNGVNNAELIIANVTENDNGNYSCVVENIADKKYISVQVKLPRTGLNEGTASSASTHIYLMGIIAAAGMLGILYR